MWARELDVEDFPGTDEAVDWPTNKSTIWYLYAPVVDDVGNLLELLDVPDVDGNDGGEII